MNSGGNFENTAFSQKVCYSWGYPNHTSRNCEARGKKQHQRWTNTVQLSTKTLIKPHTSANPEKNFNFTFQTTDNILEQITQPKKILTNNNEINEVTLPLKLENKLRRRALINTGACANAMPADFYEKLREASPKSLSVLEPVSFLNVKVASGRNMKVLGQIDLQFKIDEHIFEDTFLILPSMNSVVLGNPFCRKHSIEISPGHNIFKVPEMTY